MEQNLIFGLVSGRLAVLKPSKLKYATLRVFFHGQNIVVCSNRDTSPRDLFIMTLCAATQSFFYTFFFFFTTDGFFFPRLEFCHDDETWQAIGKGFFLPWHSAHSRNWLLSYVGIHYWITSLSKVYWARLVNPTIQANTL